MRTNSEESVLHVAPNDDRWQSFISCAPTTLFQNPDWGRVIEDTYGFPPRVAMLMERETILGGLPYAEVDDFRGARRVSYAFADVCEPVGSVETSAFERCMTEDGIPWRIRSRQEFNASGGTVSNCLHHIVALPRSIQEASEKCTHKQRANVKLAVRAGLVCRRYTDEEGLAIFFSLHSSLRKKKYRLLPQPYKFFENIALRYFPCRGFVLVAECESNPVAAMFFLVQSNVLYYKFGASDVNALSYRPNNLLMWKAIEEGINRGFKFLDLGISETEGLSRFKEGLGATATPVHTVHYCGAESTEAVKEIESAIEQITKVLTEPVMPLAAAQSGGESLYRFFV